MIYYTIDSEKRLVVYLVLAIVSMIVALLLSFVGQLNTYLGLMAPSMFMVFIGLVAVFDRLIWKRSKITPHIGIPVIDGKWEGVLTRESENSGVVNRQVSLVVHQNWRKMSLIFKGERSTSEAQIISIFNTDTQNARIKWVYLARDTSGVEHVNLYGEGTTDLELIVNDGEKTLKGTYYSSKLRKGRIELNYVGKH